MAKTQKPIFDKPWSAHSVIDQSELEDHILEIDEEEKSGIRTHNFCIEMSNGSFNLGSLMDFIEEKFPYFVLSEAEIEDGNYPYKTALNRVDYTKLAWQDGTYGELLLFLLVDGIFDIPMICHKLTLSVTPRDNVKGSDGIFFGEYDGSESLCLGEAKMISNLEDGIDDGLESTYRFHGEEAEMHRKNDLLVASKNLSDNLSQSKIEYLADRLVNDPDEFPMVHPIFIAFQSDAAKEIPRSGEGSEKIRDEVIEAIEEIDELDYIHDILNDEYPGLGHHHLVFLFLPVVDVSQLRDRMKSTIFPHSSLHE